jgi:hypothetical protein
MGSNDRNASTVSWSRAGAAALLDLDGADDQQFVLMTGPTAASNEIGFAAARDFGFGPVSAAIQYGVLLLESVHWVVLKQPGETLGLLDVLLACAGYNIEVTGTIPVVDKL